MSQGFAQRKTNTFAILGAVPTLYSLANIQAAFLPAVGAVNAVGTTFVVGTAGNIAALLTAANVIGVPTTGLVAYQSVTDIGKNIFIEANTSDAAVKLREIMYNVAGVYYTAYVVVESNIPAVSVKVARV